MSLLCFALTFLLWSRFLHAYRSMHMNATMMTTRITIADEMGSTVISTKVTMDFFSSLTVSEEPVYEQQDLYIHNNIISIGTTFYDNITLVLTKISCIPMCAVIVLTEDFYVFKS